MDNRRFSVEDPTSISRVRRDVRWHSFFSSVIQHSFFKAFILMIIISNAFIIALEEEYNNTGLFKVAEWVFLIFCALEFCMKVYVEPRGFWRSGSNVFSAALLYIEHISIYCEEALREQQAAQKRRKQKRTMKQLIGSQVSKLKKWSDTNVRADENFPQIIQQLRMSLSDSDYVVTKDKSSSLTFLQSYLTTLRHQDTTLARLQQIYEEMLEVLSELMELQQEDQREEKDDGDAP
ncbi:hypothetical protein SRHO_G00203900 [Serrasalmus rhombeus]